MLAAILFLDACQRRPQVLIGALRHGLDPYRESHRLEAGGEVRVDLVLRTAGASVHVVQLAGSERPHRHAHHDLFVQVLEGRGLLTRGDERIPMRPGDVIAIARGEAHWFAAAPGTTAVALVTFAPPLDTPDWVAVDVDSAGVRR